MFNEKELRPVHQDMLRGMKIQDWFYGFNCEKCKKPLDIDALRAITLKLNAKDIGNLSIEIHCRECNANYELHAPEACDSVAKFAHFVTHQSFPFEKSDFIADFNTPASKNNLVKKYLEKMSSEETKS